MGFRRDGILIASLFEIRKELPRLFHRIALGTNDKK